jgi:hypothetical protein
MINIIWIEWMTLLSFFYMPLILVFQLKPWSIMLIFLLLSVILGLLIIKLYEKKKYFIWTSSLMMMPFFYFKTLSTFLFFMMTTILLIVYVIHRDNFETLEMREIIKVTYVYLGVAAIVLYTLSTTFQIPSEASLKIVIPFLTLFLIVSILYSRLLRHLEAGLEVWRIAKSNLRYLMIMAFVFLIFLLGDLKNIIDTLRETNDSILGTLLKPIYYIFRKYEFDINETLSVNEAMGKTEKNGFSEEIVKHGLFKDLPTRDIKINIEFFIYLTGILLTTGLLISLIIRSIRTKKGNKIEAFTKIEEKRSFIKGDKIERFVDKFLKAYSKDPKVQIKYLYKKYMIHIQNNSSISKEETTLDIQRKAEALNMKESEAIRSIYCYVRYGGGEVTKEMVEVMKFKINNSQNI